MPNSVMTMSPWATLAGPQGAVAVGPARVGASTGGEENGCGATGFAWHGSVGKGPGGAGILGPIGFFGTRGAGVGEPGSPCPALLATASDRTEVGEPLLTSQILGVDCHFCRP
jgi:hypothetical protein